MRVLIEMGCANENELGIRPIYRIDKFRTFGPLPSVHIEKELAAKIFEEAALGSPLHRICPNCGQQVVGLLMAQHQSLCQLEQALNQRQMVLLEVSKSGQPLQDIQLQQYAARLNKKQEIFAQRSIMAERLYHGHKAACAPVAQPSGKTKYSQLSGFKLQKGGGECPVCKQQLNAGEEAITLPCLHMSHKACLDTWFQKSKKKRCAVCKFQLK